MERFNNGQGGYTCDNSACTTLLWSGVNGVKEPLNRKFIYKVTKDDVVVHNHKYYCGRQCANEDKTIKQGEHP